MRRLQLQPPAARAGEGMETMEQGLSMQAESFRLILTKMCNRMVNMEKEIETLKQVVEDKNAEIAEIAQLEQRTMKLEELQLEDVMKQQQNSIEEHGELLQTLLARIEELSDRMDAAAFAKRGKSVAEHKQTRWEDPHVLYNKRHAFENVSDLIPFTCPSSSDGVIETQIDRLHQEYSTEAYVDVCQYAQSRNRTRVSGRTLETNAAWLIWH